jgi:hypothetical protein
MDSLLQHEMRVDFAYGSRTAAPIIGWRGRFTPDRCHDMR